MKPTLIKKWIKQNPLKRLFAFFALIILICPLVSKVTATTAVTGSGIFFNYLDPTQINPADGYPPDSSIGVFDITAVSNGSMTYDINVYDNGNIAGTPDPNYSSSGITNSTLAYDVDADGGLPPLVPGVYYAQNYQIRNDTAFPITFSYQGGTLSGSLSTEVDQWLWTYGQATSSLTSFTLQPGQTTNVFATVLGQTPESTAQNVSGDIIWSWSFTIPPYIATFDTQGGSTVPPQTTDSTLPLVKQVTAPTLAGFSFTGWYTDANLTTPFDFSQPLTANATIYAGWTPLSWTVNFDSQGGSATVSQTVINQKPAVSPAPPTKSGFTFVGWATNAAGTSLYSFGTPVTDNLTLYAIWKAVPTTSKQSVKSSTTVTNITPPPVAQPSVKPTTTKVAAQAPELSVQSAPLKDETTDATLPKTGETNDGTTVITGILFLACSVLFFKLKK